MGGSGKARMVIYIVVLLFVEFTGRADRRRSAAAESSLPAGNAGHMSGGSLSKSPGYLSGPRLPANPKRLPGAVPERRRRAERSRSHDSARRFPAPPARLQQSVFLRLR